MEYQRSTIGVSRYGLQILILSSFQLKDSMYMDLTPVIYQVELVY